MFSLCRIQRPSKTEHNPWANLSRSSCSLDPIWLRRKLRESLLSSNIVAAGGQEKTQEHRSWRRPHFVAIFVVLVCWSSLTHWLSNGTGVVPVVDSCTLSSSCNWAIKHYAKSFADTFNSGNIVFWSLTRWLKTWKIHQMINCAILLENSNKQNFVTDLFHNFFTWRSFSLSKKTWDRAAEHNQLLTGSGLNKPRHIDEWFASFNIWVNRIGGNWPITGFESDLVFISFLHIKADPQICQWPGHLLVTGRPQLTPDPLGSCTDS